MNRATSQVAAFSFLFNSAVQFAGAFGSRRAQRPWTQVVEEQLLLSAEEAELEPAEDVVHDRLGEADVGIVRPAARLKARVRKFLAEQFERDTVLERNRDRQREAVHQTRDGRAFLRHLDEEFTRAALGIEADSDVALVVADLEFVRDGGTLFRQSMAHRAGRGIKIVFL